MLSAWQERRLDAAGGKAGTMRFLLVPAILVAISAALAASVSAGTVSEVQSARTVICGQIKNGPYNDWSMPRALARGLGLPARLRGRTWTVVARGVKCSYALRFTRVVLRSWTTTRPGGQLRHQDQGLRGWICVKGRPLRGGRGSSGGECAFLGVGERFAFTTLGSMSLAEVKRRFSRGGLPGG